MASDRDDLAHTMTAPPRSSPVPAAAPPGETLGRYRLERELGAGAMGVVYAALDPDLERRVAVKVLRSATASLEAKDRLMREARAMARLAHPNVVTVHEVGTAAGRDFVAMELISGETLADWLRATRHRPSAILDAFIAAGRGLAAAHAAGIVHRDFKPHNVLRSRDGRIVVTDFGLAREIPAAIAPLTVPHPSAAASPALEDTLPVGSPGVAGPATARTSSSGGATSSPRTGEAPGLTVTGSLLGTPAYMAPEQWQGGAATPATDQFAYCVALWEALAGARPYPGPSFDDLRQQVARGPAALDASRIPRRLRGLLRRGLDPVPARRWSSMDALLDQLVRARRRNHLVVAGRIAAIAAAIAVLVATRREAPPAASCEPPARPLAAVWSPALRDQLRAAASADHAAALDTAAWTWRAARDAACRAAPQVRQAQLQCLDGVLAHLDTVRRAFTRAPGADAEELSAQLIDPAICQRATAAEVPRLTLAPAPDTVAAYALYVRSRGEHKPDEAEITALLGAPDTGPCARVIAARAFDLASHSVPRTRGVLADVATAADQCGDERLRADLLIQSNAYQWEQPMIGARGAAAIRQAQIAAARVMQPDLAATLAARTLAADVQRGRWDEALGLADTAITGAAARGLTGRALEAVIERNYIRLKRSEPADLTALLADVRAWRPVALAAHRAESVRRLDFEAAMVRLRLGDVDDGHAALVALWQQQPARPVPSWHRPIGGEVVDTAGRPVGGARVAVNLPLVADSAGIGLPQIDSSALRDDDLHVTTSDASGRFAFPDSAPSSTIAAELGDRRSVPIAAAARVRLVLEPTRRIAGRVEHIGAATTTAGVQVSAEGDTPSGYAYLVAPIRGDGTFEIAGAPVRALRIATHRRGNREFDGQGRFQEVPASPSDATGIALDFALSDRVLDVIARSAIAMPLNGAEVLVIPGKHPIRSIDELLHHANRGGQQRMAIPITSGDAPAPVRDQLRAGDLVAHLEHVELGELTVCAISFPGDMMDPTAREQLQAHIKQLAIACAPIAADAATVVLAVPPQQRLD